MTRAEILNCLTDRPCDSCKFHESGRCERWDCVFEEKPDDCEDAISRQAVEEIINDIRDCISVDGYWAILERLKKLPSVTPKQKMGRWITHWNTAHQKEYYYCSECREEFSYDGETGIKMNGYTFCPNCGSYNGGNSNVNE